MDRRIFISHASADKSFAIGIQQALGVDVWVDLYEIKIGDVLIDEIAKGIEQATDFVLVWSRHSAASTWVSYELQMALVRRIEDQAIAIRVIPIDQTPLPLQLRPFRHSRNVFSVTEAIEVLLDDPPRHPKIKTFVDRNDIINEIERALHDDTVSVLWLWGLPGIGKRAVVAEALKRLMGDRPRAATLEIKPGTGEVELGLEIAAAVGAHLPEEGLGVTGALEVAERIVAEFTASSGVWVFADAQFWLEEDAHPGPIAQALIASVQNAPGPNSGRLAVFTSTRRPRIPGEWNDFLILLSVEGLGTDFGVALMRARGATEDTMVLREAVEWFGGHPLAIEIAATHTGAEWIDDRSTVAADIIARTPVSDTTSTLLEIVSAVDGPLPGHDLASTMGIGSEKFQRSVEEAVSYGLLRSDSTGFLVMHSLPKDFYLRRFRRHGDFKERLSGLASRSRRFFEITSLGSSMYVRSLVTTFRLLAASGRLDEAVSLRADLFGVLYETAVQLYRASPPDYSTALEYFDQVIAFDSQHVHARLYAARCLAHMGNLQAARQAADQLLIEQPSNSNVLRVRGRIEYIGRDWLKAAYFYELAIAAGRRTYTPLLVDLAQARVRMGDWGGARLVIQEAIDQGDNTPFTLDLHSQVLEHFGEFETSFAFMRRAVEQDPFNPTFRHRLGRIAEQTGDVEEATRQYIKALDLVPDHPASLLSLANLLADVGRTSDAEAVLAKGRASHLPLPILLNIEAKIHLRKGEIGRAREKIDRAIRERRDFENIVVAIQVVVEELRSNAHLCDERLPRLRSLVKELAGSDHHEHGLRLYDEAESVCYGRSTTG